MGDRLVGAHPSNPYGHWEDRDFLDPNAALLNGKLNTVEWRRLVGSVINNRRQSGVPWGWKDPRTCNLLSQYLEFFTAPKFIRCVRTAEEIEASMVRAYGHCGWTPEGSKAVRLCREQELDLYLPWYDTLAVDFDDLRSNRQKAVGQIGQFCELPNLTRARIQRAVDFVRPDTAAPAGTSLVCSRANRQIPHKVRLRL